MNGGTRTVIYIKNGRYREKLTVDRPRVTLRGESRNGVVLTYDASADTPSPGGSTFGTRGSYTLRIVAPDFRAEHITIENAFDYPANAAKAADDPTKIKNTQGVAVMTDLGHDRAVFDDVRILGHQDTLFVNSGRAWFHACEIAGSVDFIFGAGQSVFEGCDIISRDRGSATNNGSVTAPSTDASQPYGMLFLHSRLKTERADMAPGTRIWYEPESARFFEYGSTGAGAQPSGSRRLLTKKEMQRYTRVNVFSGWNPQPLLETRNADVAANTRRREAPSSTKGWVADQQELGERGGISRVEEFFEGRFPGVRVLRHQGGFSVQVRGLTTINGNSAPLYVIDGLAIDAGPDGLSMLNPSDISRIEVLKDATQLAMYGVRGANGVVVITTKRPN